MIPASVAFRPKPQQFPFTTPSIIEEAFTSRYRHYFRVLAVLRRIRKFVPQLGLVGRSPGNILLRLRQMNWRRQATLWGARKPDNQRALPRHHWCRRVRGQTVVRLARPTLSPMTGPHTHEFERGTLLSLRLGTLGI